MVRKKMSSIKNCQKKDEEGKIIKNITKPAKIQKKPSKKLKFVKQQSDPNSKPKPKPILPSSPKKLTTFAKKIISEIEPKFTNETKNQISFATRMMLKMGWEIQKGLGKNSHGMVNYIKVVSKNDNQGIGLKEEKLKHTRKSNPTKKERREKLQMKKAKKLLKQHLKNGNALEVDEDGIEIIDFEQWKMEHHFVETMFDDIEANFENLEL
jgi:hypothetical protein